MPGLKFSKQAHHRNLARIFISMVSREDKRGGPGAVVDHSDRNHQVGPARKVVGIGNVKVAKLPALKGIINRGSNHDFTRGV